MREHLRAGTFERRTSRSHHSDQIEGYVGLPKVVSHGESYIKKLGAGSYMFNQIHGVTDGIVDGGDHKSAAPTYSASCSKAETESRRPITRTQRLSSEYIRPTLK